MKKSIPHNQPKARSWAAVAMIQSPGKGAHGGGKRSERRRDRHATKRALRDPNHT